MRHARFILAAALAAVGLLGQPADAGIIWVGTNMGNIYTVDTSTAAATLVGNSGVEGLTDVAFDDSGNLWGIDFGMLYSVNPATGAATTVGGLGYGAANALTFGNGSLYLAGFSAPNALFTVNTTTGAATAVGSIGYFSAGDLAFDPLGTLYLTTTTNQLVSVNTTTGAGTAIGGIGFSDVYGLAYVDGSMWGISNNGLFEIDLTTGAGGNATSISGLGSENVVWGASAPAPIPEPGSLLLLGSGLAGLALRRRRRRQP
jgi:hypothetical protein